MFAAILGPSLPDFQHNTGVNVDRIAFIIVTINVGFLIGSFASGICYDMLDNNLVLALSLTILGTLLLVPPWCDSLAKLFVVFTFVGMAYGFVETGN